MRKICFLLIAFLVLLGSAAFAGSPVYLVNRTAVAIAAAGTTFDVTTSRLNNWATRYVVECPNMTGNGTTTVSIIDADGVTVFTGSAHAENATYSVEIAVAARPKGLELIGVYTIRLTLSIAAGGSGATAYIRLLGE
jgi:hypothetical protein